jgi:soluble lytic murein transglycosylase-like protein
MYGIEPKLAAAIVQTESSFNPKAIGEVGEVGLFQIRPEHTKYTPEQLLDPETNVVAGLEILKGYKQRCKFQKRKMFVVCYNMGVAGAYRLKRPLDNKYYRKVYLQYLAYSRM